MKNIKVHSGRRAALAMALAFIVLLCGFSQGAVAQTVVLGAQNDNTLFQTTDGSLSNGRGAHMFTGRQTNTTRRRAVLRFDIADGIPAGATITSVQLRLNMSLTTAGDVPIEIHRLTADWGESSSNAAGDETAGAPSGTNDATWIHRFYNTTLWSNPGGDFSPTVSAVTTIGDVGFYTWASTPQLVADAQAMLDNPAQNFGWILIGNESVNNTVKRFDTRENSLGVNRPQLIISYTTGPPPCPPDFTDSTGGEPDGVVNVFDLFILLDNWGTNGTGANLAAPNNVVDVFDLFVMLDAWGDC